MADSLKAIQKNLLATAGRDAQQSFRNLADFLSVELRLTACAPMATCLRCWYECWAKLYRTTASSIPWEAAAWARSSAQKIPGSAAKWR